MGRDERHGKMKKATGRGGKRKNAGRKKGSVSKNRKVPMSIRLSEKHINWLNSMPNKTAAIEAAIDIQMIMSKNEN